MAQGIVATNGNAHDLAGEHRAVMQITAGREMARIERYMPFLATVASTSPFVGLFGTGSGAS